MKSNTFLSIICALLMLFILTSPNKSISAVLTGVNTWSNGIFPVLFPFFVLSSILKQTGTMEKAAYKLSKKGDYSIIFITAISLICGYPTSSKLIGQSESIKNPIPIYALSTSPSPIFIIGTISAILLKNKLFSLYILPSVYLSLITSYIITNNLYKGVKSVHSEPKSQEKPQTGTMLHIAILDGLKAQGIILGIISLVSIINAALEQTRILLFISAAFAPAARFLNVPASVIQTLVKGLLEMTTGITNVCNSNISTYHKLLFSAFLASFGGMAVILESISFINGKISAGKIVLIKLLHGVLTLLFLKLLLFIFPISQSTAMQIQKGQTQSPLLLFALSCIVAFFIHELLRRIACLRH